MSENKVTIDLGQLFLWVIFLLFLHRNWHFLMNLEDVLG